MKKVYVVGEAKHYADFIKDFTLVEDIKNADIVIFTGGEDVDPALYGEKKHFTTYSNIDRDMYEKKIFEEVEPNQLVVAICRGSQFVCVMNGGKLIQDCNEHAMFGTHSIIDNETDVIYEITSTHHQMQYPFNLPQNYYTLKAIAHGNRSYYYAGTGINEVAILRYGEPEIVIYHVPNKPRCIAIQGHPEYMRKEAPVVTYLNDLINENLNLLK